jgi:hypothetical protein
LKNCVKLTFFNLLVANSLGLVLNFLFADLLLGLGALGGRFIDFSVVGSGSLGGLCFGSLGCSSGSVLIDRPIVGFACSIEKRELASKFFLLGSFWE